MAIDPAIALDAEEAVLGAVLVEPERAAEVAALLKPEDFGEPRNRHVFEAIQALASRSEGVDLITLGNELAQRGTAQSVGGRARLAELTRTVTSSAHLRHHVHIVAHTAAVRRVRDLAKAIVNESSDVAPLNGSTQEFLDGAIERMTEAGTVFRAGGPEFVGAGVRSLRQRIASGPDDKLDGLRTGFAALDRLVCGMHSGDLVVVGARPSIGKSALVLCIATNVLTQDADTPVLIFSLEMTGRAMVERLASVRSGVDHYLINTRQIVGGNCDKLKRALAEIEALKLAIDETPVQSIMSIRATARTFKQRYGLQLVVVDYLQLVEARGAENRLQEVSAVSRGLKTLARELGVPVIAAAQLSRAADTEEPKLSHFRESGTIETDADIGILLHRIDEPDDASEPRIVDAIVAKNRNGPVGTGKLLFQPKLVRFVDPPPGARNGVA